MARILGAAAHVDLGCEAARTAHLSVSLDMNGYNNEDGGALIEAGAAAARPA
jgi:hypothetical protein